MRDATVQRYTVEVISPYKNYGEPGKPLLWRELWSGHFPDSHLTAGTERCVNYRPCLFNDRGTISAMWDICERRLFPPGGQIKTRNGSPYWRTISW
jgi:hypothetical protein